MCPNTKSSPNVLLSPDKQTSTSKLIYHYTQTTWHTFPSTVAAIGITSKQSLTAFHTFSPHSSPNLFKHSLHHHQVLYMQYLLTHVAHWAALMSISVALYQIPAYTARPWIWMRLLYCIMHLILSYDGTKLYCSVRGTQT